MNRPGYDDAGHMDQIANRQVQLSRAIDDYRTQVAVILRVPSRLLDSSNRKSMVDGILVSSEVRRNRSGWCDCRRRDRDLVSRMSDSSSGFWLLERFVCPMFIVSDVGESNYMKQ